MRITWQERCQKTAELQAKDSLSIRELAAQLDFSKSQVQIDLVLARALKVYPQLKSIKRYTEAIAYIRKRRFGRADDPTRRPVHPNRES
jgi:transcriptional antiterminator